MSGVLIQVTRYHRQGRGRYYRPKSQGYTDTALRAGVFTREYAEAHCRGEEEKLEVAEDPLGREPGGTIEYEWREDDRELYAYLHGVEQGRAKTIEWLGEPGHFVCADDCHWHLHTHVGSWCISSVGEHFPKGAASMQIMGSAVGFGPGVPRMYYETVVVRIDEKGEQHWPEEVGDRYHSRAEARDGHHHYVNEYARRQT